MRSVVPLLLALAITGGALIAGSPAPPPAPEVARANDNRAPAGRRHGDTLTLRLETRSAMWHPDGDDAPGALVPAFAEADGAAQIPGPLVRVPAGTVVAATVRNALPDTLVLHGLHDRVATAAMPAARPTGVRLAPGATHAVRLRLDAPGVYYYWGTTTGRALNFRTREDAQLTGAIVVDARGTPAGAPPRDRVLVLGMWTDTVARADTRRQRLLAVINGRSWPHTERLAYAVGDSVRWHVINASGDLHPMHLHGFYFRVDARGDGTADTSYRDGVARLANTEAMFPGTTLSLAWVPERAGNWLFHCHIPEHFEPRGPLGMALAPAATAHAAHGAHTMSGLVLGVTVRDRPAARAIAVARVRGPESKPEPERRRLRLLVRENAGSTAEAPLFGFALQEGAAVPPRDSGLRVGPPLVLTRGQPVGITLVNALPQPTAVHWHGIELESYYDGVAGFSGLGRRIAPLVAPGDSFDVRFTPPRAGTFIYHTHVDEENQQLAGLAGPLLVLEPGARHDPATDVPVLVTSPRDPAASARGVLLNGVASPAPLTMRAGVAHRVRFINMTVRRAGLLVELRRDTTRLRWRRLAKDGADLPEAWRAPVPARHPLSIGETVDVEITPGTPGDTLQLQVWTVLGRLMGRWPIHVR